MENTQHNNSNLGGSDELDLDVLSRFVMGLPLPAKLSRAQIRARIHATPEAAEIVRDMRSDLSDLLDLRQGWFGWKGAVRAARHQGRVSTDARLQRAWEYHLTEDPAFAARVQRTETVFAKYGNWMHSILAPRPVFQPVLATTTACLLVFFFASHHVTNPSSHRHDTNPSSHVSPFLNAGDKGVPQFSSGQPLASSSQGDGYMTAGKILNSHIKPQDSALPGMISHWEDAEEAFPDDPSVKNKLYDLYTRVLNAPLSTTELHVGDLAAYRTRRDAEKKWLEEHPFRPRQ